MPKVDREKSGPPGPLLAEKNGPGGPLFSAKSGPALPKVDLVHFVKKKVDPVQFWHGKKVDLVQFRCQNLNRSVFGRGKKWTRCQVKMGTTTKWGPPSPFLSNFGDPHPQIYHKYGDPSRILGTPHF